MQRQHQRGAPGAWGWPGTGELQVWALTLHGGLRGERCTPRWRPRARPLSQAPLVPSFGLLFGSPVQPPGTWPAHLASRWPGSPWAHLTRSLSWLRVTESHSWSILAPCRVLAHPRFGGPISSEHALPFHMSSWTMSPFCINFIVFQIHTTPTPESRAPQPEHC